MHATLRRGGRVMLIYAMLSAVIFAAYLALPSSFIPEDDQGYFMTSIQLPSDATQERTRHVVDRLEKTIMERPGIASNISIFGFGFSGSGPNTAMAFTTLKEWGERQGATADGEAKFVQTKMNDDPAATVMSLMPPAISDMGTSSGFDLYLEDRAGRGFAALLQTASELTEKANNSGVVSDVYIEGLPAGVSATLEVDREKAQAMGVSFDDINQMLSVAIGSNYVNDYVDNGRVQQVIVQADSRYRMQLADLLKLYVRNASGEMVPLSAFISTDWTQSPQQLSRYQGYPAIKITGSAAAGYSSGAAMAEMDRLAASLPAGYYAEWTGTSLQERSSAAQMPLLIALSVLIVFLVLAALYESWSVPLSVILVVPLGMAGALLAVFLAGMSNDVFFKVGMITLIGLSTKNAILIVEFARQLYAQGEPLLEATKQAARLRLRPIIMTSLAFTLGVVPLMMANGASKSTQNAIGTGVFGGMLSGTLLAIFFVPVFFVIITSAVQKLSGLLKRVNKG